MCQEPTSTPTGISRPRPFADSNAATAELSKASAPIPYTVSVGITTSWPALIAPTAETIPRERCSGSAQSNVSVNGAASPHRFALHRRWRGSMAPFSPASGRCPHLIAVTNLGRPARSFRACTSTKSFVLLTKSTVDDDVVSSCSTANRPPGRSQRPASPTTADITVIPSGPPNNA
ncbi:Uncharacterised protein [Mycobacterium tuberculosis]|nr:Uncharacterised protein [Mycobacterium tuberculosis]